MNKKGFTLVELLAVIAILAILVIIAVPNVLETLSSSRKNTFETEVVNIMDAASKQFVTDAINGAVDTVYTSEIDEKALQLDGAAKKYFVAFDRNGNFKRVYVSDENFCYDSLGDLVKTDVKGKAVESASGEDKDIVPTDVSSAKGCANMPEPAKEYQILN